MFTLVHYDTNEKTNLYKSCIHIGMKLNILTLVRLGKSTLCYYSLVQIRFN